jgi:hypothetical protein
VVPTMICERSQRNQLGFYQKSLNKLGLSCAKLRLS